MQLTRKKIGIDAPTDRLFFTGVLDLSALFLDLTGVERLADGAGAGAGGDWKTTTQASGCSISVAPGSDVSADAAAAGKDTTLGSMTSTVAAGGGGG